MKAFGRLDATMLRAQSAVVKLRYRPVTLASRFGLCAALVVLVGLGVAPSIAQRRSWLQDVVDDCSRISARNTALAFSPMQRTWCSYDFASVNEARRSALANCNRSVPAFMRRRAACRIVWENGRTVDGIVSRIDGYTVTIPVDVTIYDGKTGNTQNTKGKLTADVIGKRTFSIVTSTGFKLCKGTYGLRNNTISYKGTCFGSYPYSGEFVPKGYLLIGEVYVSAIDVKITHRSSYVNIVSKVSIYAR